MEIRLGTTVSKAISMLVVPKAILLPYADLAVEKFTMDRVFNLR